MTTKELIKAFEAVLFEQGLHLETDIEENVYVLGNARYLYQMTDILLDANFVQKLAENHKTIFQKLLDKLKEFAKNLRDYYNSIGHNRSREANALKEQVGDTVKYLDSIVQLFDQVAVQAVESYQQTVATEEVAVSKMETTTTVSETESVAAAEEAAPAAVAENATTETDAYGFTISDNVERGSLEISFDSKPSDEVRHVLKENKFRWHKVKKVWFGYGNRETIRDALRAAYEAETKPADTATEDPKPVSKPAESVLEHRTPAETEPAAGAGSPVGSVTGSVGAEVSATVVSVVVSPLSQAVKATPRATQRRTDRMNSPMRVVFMWKLLSKRGSYLIV